MTKNILSRIIFWWSVVNRRLINILCSNLQIVFAALCLKAGLDYPLSKFMNELNSLAVWCTMVVCVHVGCKKWASEPCVHNTHKGASTHPILCQVYVWQMARFWLYISRLLPTSYTSWETPSSYRYWFIYLYIDMCSRYLELSASIGCFWMEY